MNDSLRTKDFSWLWSEGDVASENGLKDTLEPDEEGHDLKNVDGL